MPEKLELGYISGFFGVKGWVKIYSYSRPKENICNYRSFYLDNDVNETVFVEIKPSSKHIVGKIENIDTVEQAQQLIGKKIFLNKSFLPKLKNEYYWSDLIGLIVYNQQNQLIGTITNLLETGANDVLIITNENKDEVLIPYVFSNFVISIDLSAKKMVVDWEIE